MSKWMKVDPATLKVGDRFRAVEIRGEHSKTVVTGVVTMVDGLYLYDSTDCEWTTSHYQWCIRKPKKAKPPTRPEEPPVGSLFRVDRTRKIFQRTALHYYLRLRSPGMAAPITWQWSDITEPGDTITMLELREVEQ